MDVLLGVDTVGGSCDAGRAAAIAAAMGGLMVLVLLLVATRLSMLWTLSSLSLSSLSVLSTASVVSISLELSVSSLRSLTLGFLVLCLRFGFGSRSLLSLSDALLLLVLLGCVWGSCFIAISFVFRNERVVECEMAL